MQYTDKVRKMVAGQVIALLDNTIIQNYDGESFMSWLENGKLYANTYEATEEEIEAATELSKKVSESVDLLVWELDPQNDFDF